MSAIGLYIHVPYCRVICPYCDFVRARRDAGAPAAFVDALCQEIARFEGPDEAGSIFFGGGTPSLIAADDWARIAGALRDRFVWSDVEFTIEVNPDDVDSELIRAWRDVGVNRISLGVQSFDDGMLKHLGRCHDADAARSASAQIGTAFENWSLDLIFGGRPKAWSDDASAESFAQDLAIARELAPPHLSLYALTLESGTPFSHDPSVSVSDDASLAQFRMADESLAEYEHYEISNYAKSGFRSRHNLIYWRNEAYAGFGPGAVSYLDGIRSRNAPSISAYLRAPGAKSETLKVSDRDKRIETLIQHFRTADGICIEYYLDRFGTSLEEDFGQTLAALVGRGLLSHSAGEFRPTARGFELNDEIGLALVRPVEALLSP